MKANEFEFELLLKIAVATNCSLQTTWHEVAKIAFKLCEFSCVLAFLSALDQHQMSSYALGFARSEHP